MKGRTHMAFGLLTALLLLPFLQPADSWTFIALVCIGSLLPDIDHEDSTINKLVPVTKLVPLFFGHRGFFHSLFVPMVLAIVGLMTGHVAASIYLCIGYLSHLASDAVTRLGIRPLHPFAGRVWRGPLRTGGVIEWLLLVIITILDALLAMRLLF